MLQTVPSRDASSVPAILTFLSGTETTAGQTQSRRFLVSCGRFGWDRSRRLPSTRPLSARRAILAAVEPARKRADGPDVFSIFLCYCRRVSQGSREGKAWDLPHPRGLRQRRPGKRLKSVSLEGVRFLHELWPMGDGEEPQPVRLSCLPSLGGVDQPSFEPGRSRAGSAPQSPRKRPTGPSPSPRCVAAPPPARRRTPRLPVEIAAHVQRFWSAWLSLPVHSTIRVAGGPSPEPGIDQTEWARPASHVRVIAHPG